MPKKPKGELRWEPRSGVAGQRLDLMLDNKRLGSFYYEGEAPEGFRTILGLMVKAYNEVDHVKD